MRALGFKISKESIEDMIGKAHNRSTSNDTPTLSIDVMRVIKENFS